MPTVTEGRYSSVMYNSKIDLVETIRAKAKEGLKEKAEEIKREMVGIAPVNKTNPRHAGYLRDHIKIIQDSEYEYFIGTDDVSYAKFANNGRGPVTAPSRPGGKKAFVFEINGKKVITKYVSGFDGNQYVQNTARKFR